MTKYINANIKDRHEFIERMVNGERFYRNGHEYFYDKNTKRNPFLMNHSTMGNIRFCFEEVRDLDFYKTLELKQEWYEDLTEPMLCYVSNMDGDKNPDNIGNIAIVDEYNEGSNYHYVARCIGYRYATPIATLSELNKLQEEKK